MHREREREYICDLVSCCRKVGAIACWKRLNNEEEESKINEKGPAKLGPSMHVVEGRSKHEQRRLGTWTLHSNVDRNFTALYLL